MEQTVWIRADTAPEREDRKRVLTTALENNFMEIAIRDEDSDTFLRIGRFHRITISSEGIALGEKHGVFVEIEGNDDIQRAASMAGDVPFVVVRVRDWKVIPVENLVAAFQGTGTSLLVEVRDPEEARLFFGALERGVDGVLLDPKQPEDIVRLREVMDSTWSQEVQLVEAKVTSVRSLGMGDRVCIDTCSLLGIGEGMLIGSSSSGLFLVHSESIGSEYVGTRPFRVNAGPVQSYVLAPGDRSPYLSDLRVGDVVLVVRPDGRTRPVTIGRLKIEKRPLILLEAELDGRSHNIILQNAETVRLVSKGVPTSVVDMKVGDPVLLLVSEGGRHFGSRVKESIIER